MKKLSKERIDYIQDPDTKHMQNGSGISSNNPNPLIQVIKKKSGWVSMKIFFIKELKRDRDRTINNVLYYLWIERWCTVNPFSIHKR